VLFGLVGAVLGTLLVARQLPRQLRVFRVLLLGRGRLQPLFTRRGPRQV
jgi:hypothetical protein